ncbi:hypothetical protein Cgig2_031842 [Carnegiea gigantea]|uniref:Mic1 domain-containing protein n=1 Tax=Carnegiea gigantea TaxID=171969 RepID=A0A9Q1KRB6_9CARY|nr:hypothetical protein Cgig2_031842 [Carnegiea gigantea]
MSQLRHQGLANKLGGKLVKLGSERLELQHEPNRAMAKNYGSCVASKIPEVERDMCLKEFCALKNCMNNVDSVLSVGLIDMDPRASSSRASIGSSGSGALSHVYIQYPPMRCSIPGSKGVFYDDGNKLLLSPTSDQVFSWKVAPFDPHAEPTSDSISDGPMLSIRYSLDAKFLAVQRSSHEIQFWNKETGRTFSHKCRPESESILGFFWTDCPTCNIVLVKTSGLDLSIYDSESQSLRLVESKRINVNWYIYTHESRLVLLASGMQCKSFTGFQGLPNPLPLGAPGVPYGEPSICLLSSAGIVRLPKFEMLMAKSEANSKPVLAAEDIHVITVYGRIYCLQVDRTAMLLHCYRFYRDAVVQQGSLPIYSSKVAVSVVDNVLLVHQVDAKVVILYDLFADSRAPISAPLPLLLRGYRRAGMGSFGLTSKDDESSGSKQTSDHEMTLYKDGWAFLIPDLICDTTDGLLWKIHLDLDAISASSSDVPTVLEFLQRRKLEANKAKRLCLALARTMIVERRPVNIVSRAMDVLITSYSHAIKTGSYFKGMKAEKSPASCTQRIHCPKSAAEDFTHTGDSRGGVLKIDSASEISNESHRRYSMLSDSDSEGNVGPSSACRKGIMGTETFVAKVQPSSQLSGPTHVPLDVDKAETEDSHVTTAAISPDEIYLFVFAQADEEMGGDPSYLVAVMVEFLRSANLERIRIYPNVYVLMIKLLARSDRFAELGLFVIDKIIEPSKEVAYQLLLAGRRHFPTRKLGIDMLRQLHLHHDYILSLCQDGYYLEALRYARKLKVVTIRPSLFLESACASNDSQRLATVLRFFADFIPGFRSTSDHATYCHILSQMNSSSLSA